MDLRSGNGNGCREENLKQRSCVAGTDARRRKVTNQTAATEHQNTRTKAKPPQNFRFAGVLNLAERVRFELTVPLKVHWISSPAHSTTLPPFRVFRLTAMKLLRQIQAGRCLGEKDYRTAKSDFQAPHQKNLRETWQETADANQAAGTSRRSTPPRYGRSAAGTVTEPSAFWKFSSTATSVRPTARPEPFNV